MRTILGVEIVLAPTVKGDALAHLESRLVEKKFSARFIDALDEFSVMTLDALQLVDQSSLNSI